MSNKKFPILNDFREKRNLPMYIPWSVAEKAYPIYANKYGGSGQSLERIAERGGFAGSEMDLFYPNWLNESNEVNILKKEIDDLQANRRVDKDIKSAYLERIQQLESENEENLVVIKEMKRIYKQDISTANQMLLDCSEIADLEEGADPEYLNVVDNQTRQFHKANKSLAIITEDKYKVGTRLLAAGFVGTVIENYKMPGDICVEWDTGQKSSYDRSWLDENVQILPENK